MAARVENQNSVEAGWGSWKLPWNSPVSGQNLQKSREGFVTRWESLELELILFGSILFIPFFPPVNSSLPSILLATLAFLYILYISSYMFAGLLTFYLSVCIFPWPFIYSLICRVCFIVFYLKKFAKHITLVLNYFNVLVILKVMEVELSK